MIEKEKDKGYIYDNACIPEHIYTYVCGISGAEAFLSRPYIYYIREGLLIFIGYPLKEDFKPGNLKDILEKAVFKTGCNRLRVILPSYPIKGLDYRLLSSDEYYRLDVDDITINQKNMNMVNRASRDLYIERTRIFDVEHRHMVELFLQDKPLDEGTSWIINNMDAYIRNSDTAWIINARDRKDRLVAFDVIDMFSRDYIFYMFNIRTKTLHVPGASDLLLYEIIKMAKDTHKKYVNLGLGINKGVMFFKKKWGGRPFLSYFLVEGEPDTKAKILSLMDKIL